MTRRQALIQKRHARERRRRAVMTVLCVFVAVFVFSSFFSIADDPALAQEVTVIAEPGDTLWSIVANHYGDDSNVRKWISEVRARNGMSSDMISIGDKIILPAGK